MLGADAPSIVMDALRDKATADHINFVCAELKRGARPMPQLPLHPPPGEQDLDWRRTSALDRLSHRDASAANGQRPELP